MIVPRSRLLIWVALIVVPFATLAGIVSDSTALALGLVALFFALALLDAVLGLGVLDGISVELPKVVRLSKDHVGELELLIRNERQKEREVRFGLPFPREISPAQDDLTARLPAASPLSKLRWPCTAHYRGSFRLHQCHLEAASPLGFWGIRAIRPVNGELRVYPDLLTERRTVGAVFLNRGTLGAHAQRQVGKGREFEKLREYVPGDGFDEIHWKATARRGRPVTKVFQIERTQEVYVIVDASRLSARPVATNDRGKLAETVSPTSPARNLHTSIVLPPPATALERFVTAALVLGLAAEQQGDLFGLVTFSDHIHKFVRARNGKAHYSACRDAIYTLQPERVTPDFEELCTLLRLRLRKRALLVFLTALDDPLLAESFARSIELICRHHLVLVNMIQPAGVRPLFSDASVTHLDEVYRALGGHLQWQSLRELGMTLQRRGVGFSLVNDERLSADLVTQYFNVKRRQAL
jgi:uncharacterized protein (DUF58 family)